MIMYNVFVAVDDMNLVQQIAGGKAMGTIANHPELDWVMIDSGDSERYAHCSCFYLPEGTHKLDGGGIPIYKICIVSESDALPLVTFNRYEDGVVWGLYKRTDAEMEEDYVQPVRQSTQEERIASLEAQLASYEAAFAEGVNEGWA